MPISSPKPTSRLIELDSLRGIAALLVVAFHYTTRYSQAYGHSEAPALLVSWGQYGVNMFFMISGFVIFMTLRRVTKPMDFIVSRFSRLFPAFWAAVLISFVLTHLLAVPGRTVSAATASLNLIMIHGLFKVPHVDGVYWTLEIELIFYGLSLMMFMFGQLQRSHVVLAALIALRILTYWGETYAGVHMSWTLSHLLILSYIAWFACGIMIFRLVTVRDESPRKDWAVIAFAILQLAIVESPAIGLLALGLCLVLWAGARGKLPILNNPILAWLGAISYTLYLLHQNIGFGVIMHAERAGLPSNLAILLAVTVSLTLATILTWSVERPAMAWIRGAYRRRAAPASA
jgi:peptidoglycan/LPS O-acetylase OafA/YrhL